MLVHRNKQEQIHTVDAGVFGSRNLSKLRKSGYVTIRTQLYRGYMGPARNIFTDYSTVIPTEGYSIESSCISTINPCIHSKTL
jgi:hypothetical protein